MKYICRLIMRQNLRDALAIPQDHIVRNSDSADAEMRQRPSSEVSANNIPPFAVQELDHMRSDKSFCAGYKCGFFHWSSQVVSRWNLISVTLNTRILIDVIRSSEGIAIGMLIGQEIRKT